MTPDTRSYCSLLPSVTPKCKSDSRQSRLDAAVPMPLKVAFDSTHSFDTRRLQFITRVETLKHIRPLKRSLDEDIVLYSYNRLVY